jgi:UPF0755 protein
VNSLFRKLILAVLVLGSLIGGFLSALFWLNSIFFSPFKPGSEPGVPFLVERGWSVGVVSEELGKQGITRNTWVIKVLARLKRKQLPEILSGEYSLSPSMSPREILQKFINKDLVYHSLTIPEGSTLKQIRDLMVRTTIVSANDAERALNDRALYSQLRIPASTLEGYLYPETYRFSRPDTAEMMVQAMIKEGEKRKTKERDERARALGLSWHQVLVLASIIEKESGNNDPQERRKISSVFHNRLRIKMSLQSDPTVIYGIPDFNGNLTKADLQTPTAHNTYVIDGLPPSPICSPGEEAIKATLEPLDTDYLYFVSRGDGSSYFSAEYDEHRGAVKKFQVDPVKNDRLKKDLVINQSAKNDSVKKEPEKSGGLSEEDLEAILGEEKPN